MNLTVDAWIMTEARRASEIHDMPLSRLFSEGVAMRIAQLDSETHKRQRVEAGLDRTAQLEAEERSFFQNRAAVETESTPNSVR